MELSEYTVRSRDDLLGVLYGKWINRWPILLGDSQCPQPYGWVEFVGMVLVSEAEGGAHGAHDVVVGLLVVCVIRGDVGQLRIDDLLEWKASDHRPPDGIQNISIAVQR